MQRKLSVKSFNDSFAGLISRLLLEAGAMAVAMQKQIDSWEKADGSDITQADLAISAFLRKELASLPGDQHLVFDEEEVDKNKTTPSAFFKTSKPYVWFIDPIAGTTCYAAGMPLYAISIGVLKDGRPFAGGVYFPALKELYMADGAKAYFSSDTEAVQELEMPKAESLSRKPLFQHSSTRVISRYNIVSKELPFVLMPSVNIGLMWTATGKFCASVIRLKLWDFAGAWAILDALGFTLRCADSGKELTNISSEDIGDDWGLTNAYIVSHPALFDKIQVQILKSLD